MEVVESVDVCIVGGGVSGLTAAYDLLKRHAGLTVILLEAKDRLGGRTYGQELNGSNGKEKWDLGGQWVGKTQHHAMNLLQELSLDTYEQFATGRKVMQLGSNEVKTYNSTIPKLPVFSLLELHQFMRKMKQWQGTVEACDSNPASHLSNQLEQWDNVTAENIKLQHLRTSGTRDAIDATVRCMFGVEASEMSQLYFLKYAVAAGGFEPLIEASEGGGQQFKIKGGAFQISEKLASAIGSSLIRLKEAVVSVVQTDREVRIVTSADHVYICERLILAIPPQEIMKICFSPSLPLDKRHVFQRMPVGNLTKVIVTYKKAFWRTAGFSGEAVTNGGTSVVDGCDTGPLCIIYDATSSTGSPALVSFIGGRQQIMYADKSKEDRRRAVIHSLVELFGQEAADVLDYAEKNWNEELYNGGCPVSVATPGIGLQMAAALREPYHRIHFAGTESATEWCGFINGAVQAGQRAAYEVLYNLRPQALSNSEYEATWYHQGVADKSSPRKRQGRGFNVVRWLIGAGLAGLLVYAWRRRVILGR